MSDIAGVSQRLGQRRAAHLLSTYSRMSNIDSLDGQSSSPRIRRGPARSWDDAITHQPGPWTHSVASSSADDDPGVSVSQGVCPRTDSASSPAYHHAPSSSSSSNAGFLSEMNRQLRVRSFRPHNPFSETNEDEIISPVGSVHRHTTPTTAARPMQRNDDQNPTHCTFICHEMQPSSHKSVHPHEVAPSADFTTPASTLTQHSYRQSLRQYRPYSWSDPSEDPIAPLTISVRRRVRQVHLQQHRHSSSASDLSFGGDGSRSLHTRSQSAGIEGSMNEVNRSTTSDLQSGVTLIRSSLRSQESAVSTAVSRVLSNSTSPLDAISRESSAEHTNGSAWSRDLPIRLSTQGAAQNIRFPPFSSSDSSPTSPISQSAFVIPMPLEEDQELTPRFRAPPTPRPRRAEMSPTRTTLSSIHFSPEAHEGSNSPPQAHRRGPAVDGENMASPPQQRIHRRPVPTQQTPAITQPLNVPRLSAAEFREQLLLRQQTSFYSDLAQSNDGYLPQDAHTRWLQYARHVMPTSSPSNELPQRSHAFRRPPRRSDAILQPSDSAGNRGVLDPFEPSRPSSMSMERADPRGMGLEFAVARGGRPRLDTTWRAPVQVLRTNAVHIAHGTDREDRGSSFDQENIDGGEAWSRFDLERTGANRAATGEDNTPPGVGRLRRYI